MFLAILAKGGTWFRFFIHKYFSSCEKGVSFLNIMYNPLIRQDGGNEMDERMVQDLLKEGLAFLKEQSVMDFIKNDQAYQESSEATGKLKNNI